MFDYKTLIYDSAKNVLNGLEPSDVTAAEAFCDYCVPCFKFAKILRKSPAAIAAEAAAQLTIDGIKVEALNGYLNFSIERESFIRNAFGKSAAYKPLAGKTVCLDYSSVNIAKPFHIGHLMTTVIGGALCNIYRELGAEVVGINHLGDWGTQFGGLISAYRRWGDEARLNARGLEELFELYVRYQNESEM